MVLLPLRPATLCAPLLAGPTAGADCPKAGVTTNAANVTDRRKSRCTFMPTCLMTQPTSSGCRHTRHYYPESDQGKYLNRTPKKVLTRPVGASCVREALDRWQLCYCRCVHLFDDFMFVCLGRVDGFDQDECTGERGSFSQTRVVLIGARAGSTPAAPTAPGMPSFGWNL
jgi:hypothetical protein